MQCGLLLTVSFRFQVAAAGGLAPQAWSLFNNFVKVISGVRIRMADVNVKGGWWYVLGQCEGRI